MVDSYLPCGCILAYRCSDCGRCYVHSHEAAYLEHQDTWTWMGANGNSCEHPLRCEEVEG
jgi:hypothetical protein